MDQRGAAVKQDHRKPTVWLKRQEDDRFLKK